MIDGMELGTPDTVIGFAAFVVIQISLLGGQYLHARTVSRRNHENRTAVRDDIRDVKESVVNDHGNNLREDIDRVLDFCEEFKAGLADLRGEMRGEMRAVTHRIDQITTVTSPHIIKPNPRQGW